jgi:hypothetical protein
MALYPKDSTSSRMPSRASASSSTIEINGSLDIPVPENKGRHKQALSNINSLFEKLDVAQLANDIAFLPVDHCANVRFTTESGHC